MAMMHNEINHVTVTISTVNFAVTEKTPDQHYLRNHHATYFKNNLHSNVKLQLTMTWTADSNLSY